MNPSQRFEQRAAANSLFWMGAALIGLFAVTVLAGMLPVGLLLPAWQVKMSALIISAAPFAAIGAILILLAHQLDDDSDELEKWVRRLRLWSVPVAIGFFLLIPLQTYNGYRLVRIASGQDQQSVGQLQKNLAAIQSAQNEDQFRAAVSQIPGAPPNLGKLNIPLPQAKQRIADQLSGQIKKLDNLAEERNAARWQQSFVGWARSCLISLFFGAGFAEIARFPRARNSLLFSILSSLPGNRRMRSPLKY
jgi:hypothetical protein